MQKQSNKIDFKGRHIYVGIDVHLKSWKVTVVTERLTVKTFSQDPSPEILHQFLVRNFPNANYHSAYEAGFCGYWIHNRLVALGIDSIVVNPADIPTTDKERVNKTDQRDSKKIAQSLRSGHLKGIYVPSSKTLEDRNLIRARSLLVKDLSRNKNRIKTFLHFRGIEIPEQFKSKSTHWSKRFMTWLKSIDLSEDSASESLNLLISTSEDLRATILQANRKIRSMSESETYVTKAKLLRTIPGIGLLTAMILLTEIETITRFSNFDKLCSFIGLIPSTNSSGEKDITGKLTRRGNNFIRSTIVECAWIAARRDLSLNKSFHEYCKRMDANKAIIRIARKLLNRVRFVLVNNKPYECSVVQ
ncbi:MAG: IS110 family transposase [Bacteroidales bacterium]|nr:IS110 family transposase [Bacteroidales bacterium]